MIILTAQVAVTLPSGLQSTIQLLFTCLKPSTLERSCKSVPMGMSGASADCTTNTEGSIYKKEKHN